MFIIDDSSGNQDVPAKLKIMGIGGGGSNAITYMYKQNLSNSYLIAANTDAKALSITLAHKKITLGEGLGAGGDPEKGKAAMETSLEEVKETIKDTDLLILIATLGGGTGTGGIPVVANLARELGILTIAIVTLPFAFEGKKRMKKALTALEKLEDLVDTLLVIEDEKLIEIAPQGLSYEEAFHIADNMLYQAVRGITSIIFRVGVVNVDFADLEATLKEGGRAIMGSGTGRGENAVMEAVEQAINNPLLKDGTMINARNILAYFTGIPERMPLKKIQDAVNYIKEITNTTDEEHEVFFGIGNFPYGEEPDYDVEVTIIATRGKTEAIETDISQENAHGNEKHDTEDTTMEPEKRRLLRTPSIFKRKGHNKH